MSNFNISAINKIYVYYRVSTPTQANNEHYGLDKQTEKCDYYAKQIFDQNENQLNYYCDIGSSYNNKNILKEQLKMIRDMEQGSVILIHDVSRLGRNISQVFKLLKKVRDNGSYIISIDDNVCYGKTRLLDKKFWYKIIEAEESSDRKSSRMTKRINIIKSNGGHIGATPYGYSKQYINGIPRLYKNTDEQKVIAFIKSLVGKKSYTYIKCSLNNMYGCKRGKIWTIANTKTINLNAVYKTYKFIKIEIDDNMEI